MDIREVVEEHERLVLRTAYRILGRWEDAQDAAQEVFLKLHRTRESFDDRRALGPWLYRITVNTCRDAFRRRRPAGELIEYADRGLTPEEAAVLEQQRGMLHSALGQLPDGQRRAIVLREIEGLSTEEVADRLGATVGTVRSQISLGRARLRQIIAAAVAASVGLSVWLLWPRRLDLARPPAAVAAIPKAPLEFAKVVPRPVAAQRVALAEPLTIKLVSEDESIVIYWTEGKKGEDE